MLGALGGCGFQLRGDYRYAFNSIQIKGSAVPTLFMTELARALSDVPGMTVGFDAPRGRTPQLIFDVLQDQREKTAVGLSVAGQVREFQLTQRLRFRVRTPQGQLLIDESEISQIRQISYNETAALAKEAEETLLHRDMQTDIVVQVLRRLSMLRLGA